MVDKSKKLAPLFLNYNMLLVIVKYQSMVKSIFGRGILTTFLYFG